MEHPYDFPLFMEPYATKRKVFSVGYFSLGSRSLAPAGAGMSVSFHM